LTSPIPRFTAPKRLAATAFRSFRFHTSSLTLCVFFRKIGISLPEIGNSSEEIPISLFDLPISSGDLCISLGETPNSFGKTGKQKQESTSVLKARPPLHSSLA